MPHRDTPHDETLDRARPPADPDASTLQQPSAGQPSTAAGPADAGRYHVLRRHAYGGLGEVFVARDAELGREVALKRLRPHRADDPNSRRRFVTEAAVTARLEHPGVVPIHGLVRDADGRPAYAMRFIQGDTLAAAIEHFHGAAAKPDARKSAGEIVIDVLAGGARPRFDSLGFRQLLARFVTVCNAIAYAHGKGVIHRDLKPANVMLGPFGETLVVDWGLAKVVGGDEIQAGAESGTSGDSAETEAGDILGTPSYMAPEQAAGGAVGPAADVYGLGGILYTMLTGRPPITERAAFVAVGRARAADFPPPRAVQPAVPRPLDAVCRQAMALRPEDRYATALDLAADVERWLADEPVSADREPRWERVRRWGRRHRPAVAASLALLVTAVVGLTAATLFVSREQSRTAAAKKRAEEQRDRADQNLKLAARAVDTAARRVSGNPRLMAGDFHDLRAELLAALIPFYEELARQSGDNPAVETQRGLAHGWLGNLRRETGETDRAETAFRAAVGVFSKLAETTPADPEVRQHLYQAHNDLGLMLADLGRWAEARTELETAVRIERDRLATDQSDRDARHGLATGLNGLATIVERCSPPGDPEPLLREALALAREQLAADPAEPGSIGLCAAVENNLAIRLRVTGRPKEAEPLLRSVIERRTKLAADPGDRRDRRQLVVARFNLGNLLRATGRLPAAESEYRTAAGLAEKLTAEFSGVPEHQSDLGGALMNLAAVLGATGRAAEAVQLHRRAAGLFDRLAADFPANAMYRHSAADCWYNVGEASEKLGRPAEAEAAYRRAADGYARLAAEAPADPRRTGELAVTWVALGELARSTGDRAGALGWFDKAIARLGQSPGDGALRDAHAGRAEVLSAQGKFADALTAWDAAIAADEPAHRPMPRLRRARTLALSGDLGRAADEAKELSAALVADAEILDGSARVLALAAAKDANRYAAAAIGLLRRAHAAGRYREPGSAEKLRTDPDFAALREREDFRKFVEEVAK